MTKEIYNDFYKKYGAGVHTNPERFLTTANLCKGRVLDIGCGTGDLADYHKGEYVGIDISDVAIQYAEEMRRKDAKFRVQDLNLPIIEGEEAFDTVVIAEVLEHIDNDDVLFENIKKLAKNNARIIISVPNGNRVPDANHLREFTIPILRKKFASLGKVKFYNWFGAKHRILMSVDMGLENKNDLTLAMMCWNEEKGLEKAILSSIEFVDKVVVSVDNNSDDQTLNIARMYADVVKKHTWENNFAKARNSTQEGINSKWILSLDGHEFVEKSPNIEEKLKSDAEGLMITIQMENGDTFLTPRIYQNGLVWEHAIHNALPIKKAETYSDFMVVHDREGGQSKESTYKRIAQVKKMMLEELEKELKIPKFKTRALFYLARYYRQFYEWKKALRFYKKYLNHSTFKQEKWLCGYEAGVIANSMGKPLTALNFFRLAEKEMPNRWEISKHMGLAYLSFGRFDKAVELLVNSLNINTGDFIFKPEKRNDADTWDKIGYCFFQLGKYFEAKTSWERAVEIGTDEIQIKLNKKRIDMLEKEWGI